MSHTYEAVLKHEPKWDTLNGRTGEVMFACFHGDVFTPGRSLLLPASDWKKMGKPEAVTVIVIATPKEELDVS